MKRLFTLAVALTAVVLSAQFANAQDPDRSQGPQGPRGDFFGAARLDDGRIDLSKLPEQLPQDRKDAFKAADKDNDGFLTPEELRNIPRPPFRFNEGERPDFVNEKNEIIVEKAIEAIKGADKNKDGVIDADEQRAVADVVREKSPALPRFIAQILGDIQDRFGFGGPQGPGAGQQRPQGDRQGARSGQQRPQGERQGRGGQRQQGALPRA